MPHVYLEDIVAIDRILKEVSELDTKFTTSDYEFSNIDELKSHVGGAVIHNLDLDSPWNDKSDVRIRLYESGAYVHGSDKTLASEGAYKKVCDILKHRQRPILWVLTSWVSNIVAPALFGSSIVLMLVLLRLYGPLAGFGVFAAGLIILLLSFLSYRQSDKKFSAVELVNKSEKQSFLKRNKDQIIVGILVSLVSLVAGILLNEFVF